ncbi:hypothetical protein [Crocinitomix catalasitica]|uniref:hypothetical protein n=1 Tax=Crocinitomix catalasitica TaxID=184607 RepID=UPI000482922B|nr:hypothetical protein [Crocinitomix catalasitica]
MKKINYLLIGLGLITMACNKHEIVPPPHPNAAALINFFDKNVEEKTQNFTVNANAFIYIEGEGGVTLMLNANKLAHANGDLVNGNVDVDLIEIYKKSDMVLLDKPTMAVNNSGQHIPLISGGEFYVSVSQDGVELVLLEPMKLRVSNELDRGMRKFVNVSEDDLLWGIAEDSLLDEEFEDTLDGEGGYSVGYDILPGEWGWTNIDKWYSDPRPKTTIFAEVPEGFDNENTEVYISYDGEGPALANFDRWVDGRFTEHYGLIPIGLEVHFIAVAIIDGSLNYVIQAATIEADHVQDISGFEPTTEEALIDLIDALP